MSKFRHLEIRQRESEEEQQTDASVESRGTPVRDAAYHMQCAKEADERGRFETALQLYTRALRDDRALVPAWVGQVQMLVQLGEYHEARLWSDKALELFRNNGELLAAKSQACLRQGDRRAAVACSDASLQSTGSSTTRWQVRGEILLEKDPGRARDCFDKSLAEPQASWFDQLVICRIYLFHDMATAALRYAQDAVQMKSDQAYAWYLLGQCQESIGWHDQAAVTYERCLEVSSDFAEACAALAAIENRTLTQRVLHWFGGLLRR